MKAIPELQTLINQKKDQWINLARTIWKTPELAYKEVKAAALQADLLNSLGFTVKAPFAGVDTAYRAERGEGEPTFCFVAEYDALPALGHGCGHNLICAAAIAAGWATAELLKQQNLPGRIVVMGTPAEESGGGKVLMLSENALEGINAIMMLHPSWRTVLDCGSTAVRRYEVTFHGKSSHAASDPELGVNALDAIMLLFAGINAWRQHMPESGLIHGVVLEGGHAPNIIPDKAVCKFYLRSPSEKDLDSIEKRFHEIVRGAELMTGATAETKPYNIPYRARKPNVPLNETYLSAARELGMSPQIPQKTGRGSSDFGDFSQVLPGIHPYFGISTKKIAGHSVDFAEAANSDYGMEQMLKAAAAMAYTGFKYLTDESLRMTVAENFQEKEKE